MGLSEREQKLLEEMERNLMAQDAEFAKTISKTTSSNQSAGKLVKHRVWPDWRSKS